VDLQESCDAHKHAIANVQKYVRQRIAGIGESNFPAFDSLIKFLGCVELNPRETIEPCSKATRGYSIGTFSVAKIESMLFHKSP